MTAITIGKVQNLCAWLLVSLAATGCANTPYADAPQAGQSVSGASLIFCRTSLAWPQASHL